VNTYPTYSPALVAFVPFAQNDIGWVPLAPGDPYAPRYYNNDWQPYYLTRTQIVQPQVANLYIPNAVTVIPVEDFNRFDWRRERRADRQMLANINPVLDPLTLTPLRNAVIHSAWGRGKIDLPPGIAKKLQDTTVVTSTAPIAPPFRKDLARTMRVEEVGSRAGNRKFNVRDERAKGQERTAQAPTQVQVPQQPQNNEPARGRFSERQQRIQSVQSETPNARAERGSRGVMQPRGERVAQPAQPRGRPEIQRQQSPAVRKERGNMRIERPAPVNRGPERPVVQPRMREERGRTVIRPSQPTPQVQPRAMEQPRNPGNGRGRPDKSQPAAPQAQPRPTHPGNGQGAVRQQQQQQQKAGPPQGQPGGGKGKGKKP
jgi:hypothetical protein